MDDNIVNSTNFKRRLEKSTFYFVKLIKRICGKCFRLWLCVKVRITHIISNNQRYDV